MPAPKDTLSRLLAKKVDPLKRPASKAYVRRQIRHGQETQFEYSTVTTNNIAYDGPETNSLGTVTAVLGDKFNIKGLMCRAKFINPASAGAVHCRLIIFQWLHDDNVDSPGIGDLLQDATGADSIISGYLLTGRNNSTSFKILKDVTVRLGEATSVEGQDKKIVRFYVPMKAFQRKVMRMTANNQGFNLPYMMAYSDVADASTPPQIEFQSVLTYTDES